MTYELGSRYPKPGDSVRVAQKKDYSSGILTEGKVKDVLTNKEFHSRGHKVRLTNGIIGRVQEFIEPESYEEKPPAQYKPGEDELV